MNSLPHTILEVRTKKKNPMEPSHYTHYSVIQPTALNERQETHIDNVFRIATDIIQLKRVMGRHPNDLVGHPLSRLIVSELHNWRLGFKNLKSKKFKFMGQPKCYIPSDNLLEYFDKRFLNVTKHRNVLQHYGNELFGDQKPANVRRGELERINVNLKLGKEAYMSHFMSNFVGDCFCSAGRDGKIHEVYIGPRFEKYVEDMLREFCHEISINKEVFEILPIFGMNLTQYSELVTESSQSLRQK